MNLHIHFKMLSENLEKSNLKLKYEIIKMLIACVSR